MHSVQNAQTWPDTSQERGRCLLIRQVAPNPAAAAQELSHLSIVWSTVERPIKQGWQSSRAVIWPNWKPWLWRILYPSRNRSRALRAPSQANQLRSRAFPAVSGLQSWWLLVLRPLPQPWEPALLYDSLHTPGLCFITPLRATPTPMPLAHYVDPKFLISNDLLNRFLQTVLLLLLQTEHTPHQTHIYIYIYICNFIYLFLAVLVFVAAQAFSNSASRGLFSSCAVQASRCRGFSYCTAWALGHAGFCSCSSWILRAQVQ